MQVITDRSGPLPLRRVPGPRGLPVVGNGFQVKPGRFHQQLDAWAEEYGDKFRFTLGQREFMAVRDPQVIASVLKQRPGTFTKSSRLVQACHDLGFHGVFSATGESWKRQRPVVLAGLDPTHVRTFLPAIGEVTRTLQERWRTAARSGASVDLLHDLMRYTVDVTTALAFGRNLHTLDSASEDVIQQHLNHLLPALYRRTLAPIDLAHWFDRKTRVHVKALREAVMGFIQEARAQLLAHPHLRAHPENLLQALLAANEREEARLTDEEVSGNVLTMLLAGEDTTANTVAWLLWLLQRNPAHRDQARAEVRRVLAGATIPSSTEQLGQLDYLEGCAMEAMRLKPVAPIIVSEVAEATVLAGVALPQGALVLCMMRPAGLDEQHFPTATQFDPARWRDGAGALSSQKRVVMPFGGGPRICPGRYLALAEIKMVTAMLLASFEVREVACADGAAPQERLALTMSPVGLRMTLGELDAAPSERCG